MSGGGPPDEVGRLRAELERTRRELEAERHRLSQFAAVASDWLWEMDADLRFTFMSGRYEEVLGLPAASILGRRREELPRVDYHDSKWLGHLADLDARRPFRSFETTMIDASGRPRMVAISGAPFYADDGAFLGYRGVGIDRTDAREREREIGRRKETLETILANIDEGVALIDSDGRLVAFNPRLLEFYGLEGADVAAGASMEELARMLADRGEYAGEDGDQAIAQRLQWARSGAPVRVERRRADGRELGIKSNPLPGGGLTITYTDITELKAAQRDLERKVVQQQAVAELGQVALKGAPVDDLFDRAVALVAAALEVEFVGLTVAQQEAGREEFLLKAGVGWQDGRVGSEIIPGDARSAAGYALQSAKPVVIEDLAADPRFSEAKLLRDHGAVSGVSVLVHGLTKPFGVVGAYTAKRRRFVEDEVAFVQSIANVLGGALARRETERAFLQAQKMEALGRLTGGVAHDFNNLLTVILGNAELLQDDLDDGSAAADLVRTIVEAGGQAAGLTRRMLQFARRQALDPVRLDLKELVERMSGLIGRSLGAEISIATSLHADVWPIVADSAQLESALLNLAINARDAMPRGGRIAIETRNVSVDTGAQPSSEDAPAGDYAMVAVADTGVGMTPDVIARAVEPFFSTKEAGKGTGLGLSIVYSFVRQSGGFLRIYSEPGRGAQVQLLFPRAAAAAGDAVAVASPVQESPRGGECVLVVEDEPQVRAFVELSLRGLGYRTLTADGGAAALAEIEAHPEIDLLLTDVIMPGGMSGPELALAAMLARPSLKVAYMSGYTDGALIQDGRIEAGAALLHKPFRRAALAQMVRSVLDS